MFRFRLGDADRQRLGCPEVLEFDASRTMINDLIELPEATGFTIVALQEALRRNRAPGSGDTDWRALKAMVWLALRHAGVAVAFDALDFDISAFRSVRDEPAAGNEDASAGKGQTADAAAVTSTET